jgi:RNA-directed DNA polymerase
MFPSNKAVNKLKESLRNEIKENREPFPMVIKRINQKTRGWKEYFKLGYPKQAYRDVNYFLQGLLKGFLKNRSQRKCQIRRNGESYYSAFKKGGLAYL